MFGIYSNKRLSEAERKILYQHPDDYNWYCVYVNLVFKDKRFFQVREDIELPQSDDDNGVVLTFPGNDIVYFKTLDGEVTEEEINSIHDVCSYLEETFDRPITAYVVCPPDIKLDFESIEGEGNVTMYLSHLSGKDGEKIIDRLEEKLKNNKQFTVSDSIDHMLLPYASFKNKEIFQEKLNHYMELVNEYGG